MKKSIVLDSKRKIQIEKLNIKKVLGCLTELDENVFNKFSNDENLEKNIFGIIIEVLPEITKIIAKATGNDEIDVKFIEEELDLDETMELIEYILALNKVGRVFKRGKAIKKIFGGQKK